MSVTPLSSPFYVADAKGFFADEGVSAAIEECISGVRCIARVLDGSADLGTASEAVVMFNSFTRTDFAMAGTFVTSRNDVKLVARKDRAIRSAADLRGRSVATVKGASAHYFLDTFLLRGGVDPATVRIVGLTPGDTPAALAAGTVDAIAVWEPYAFFAMRDLAGHADVLPSTSHYRETFNLVGMRAYLSRDGDRVRRVLRALDRAIAFIKDHEAEAKAIVRRTLGLDDAFIGWVWRDLQFGLTLDQALIATLEGEARWAMRARLVPPRPLPNYLEFLHWDALERAKPGAVTVIR